MNDTDTRPDRDDATPLRETFVDLLLEEHYGTARPRTPALQPSVAAPRTPRRARWLAAALVAAGAAIVVGVETERRSSTRTGDPATAQDPKRGDDRVLPTDARAFFPLALGNRWTYRETKNGTEREVIVEATAEAVVDGHHVVQLTELAGDDIAFTFWCDDPKGVWRMLRDGMQQDPVPGTFLASRCLELPTPVGAETQWTTHRAPEIHLPRFGAGRTPQLRAEDVFEVRAGLESTAAEIASAAPGGERWRALHVRVGDGEHREDLYYARGTGLVRSVRTVDGVRVERDLARFEPAAPRPAREAVLSGAIGDEAAKQARWLDESASAATQWTVRSDFAIVQDGDRSTVWRVLDDRAVPFDTAAVDSYAALAQDERAPERMRGLFNQRFAEGVLGLYEQLHLARDGAKVAQTGGMSAEIGAASTRLRREVSVTARDGTRTQCKLRLELRQGVPTRIGADD